MIRSIIKNGYVTALDIGTGKICCLVARVSNGTVQIIGDGYAQAKGFKNGVVVNLNEAASSIQDAVMMAEAKSNRRIENVIVNISSPQMKSTYLTEEITLPDDRPIRSADVRLLIDKAIASFPLTDHEIIHQLPISFSLDGQTDIEEEPTGLSGKTLGVCLHMISVPISVIQNLSMALERCHLSISAKVATPYAAALSVLSDSEKQNGATVLDMGFANTSIAIFSNGFIRYVACLNLGANLITQDISCILKTPMKDAERAKNLYGSAFGAPSDEKQVFNLPVIGEEDEGSLISVTKANLIAIMVPRIEEIFGYVKKFLDPQKRPDFSTRRIVLCGGGSLISGLKDKTDLLLEAKTRLGKPMNIKGLPENLPSTIFSTATGLLRYAVNQRIQKEDENIKPVGQEKNMIKRVIRWLIQNF